MKSSVFSSLLFVSLILPALGVGGCASQKSTLSNSDIQDQRRGGALAVFVNRKVTDSVDVGAGDHVDWKFVDVPQAGEIRAAVSFDDPQKVQGRVVLRDTFGRVVEEQKINAGKSLYAFSVVQAVRGRYFLEIFADSGASVYTVGVLYNDADLGAFFTKERKIEEPVENPEPKSVVAPSPKANPVETRVKKPSTRQNPQARPAPEPLPEPPEDKNTVLVRGSIQRVIPVDSGGAMVTIYISGNHSEHIKSGTAGTINGLGARVTVRSRSGNHAKAFTRVDAAELKPYKAVTFKLRR